MMVHIMLLRLEFSAAVSCVFGCGLTVTYFHVEIL
jgi:hypothetical protein